MQVLIVLAHPLPDSFAATVAKEARAALEGAGHAVEFLDLYAQDFDPRMTAQERRDHATATEASPDCQAMAEQLAAAEVLVLVFPQWWFNFPAILKGYVDRVFAPGIAFENVEGGPIRPKLTRLRHLVAFSSTGSPWWVARLVMGEPVRRLLKRGLLGGCAPQARFRMLTLYGIEASTPARRQAHLAHVRRMLSRLT
ncbi:NAD(P)H dehydrogenase [Xaviernesmea oryzae]|uniref:NAD(P)H dehydrogenase n=1 Tax=Xaviernesmea oryzae TaxID=464029 RepID=A0A1Q9AUC7_9HYPH|nr:NAD(P)H-dependent oxidoreductase [Xaviernesmea oryzae]OLP59051.1 NAD(P)H dehydrogenase [Xaviernesmea oryzae]SEK88967.1 Putative NADPH-quinone reductase (modulator of drug activity B) [Xaviernesmea oryzae]